MLRWETLDRVQMPGAGELVLARRGREYFIRVDGFELMGSRSHGSEEDLAKRGCANVCKRPGARVLVGGLGMGFTVRAALDVLERDALVDVAELVPAVVRWNREEFPDLAQRPLDDPRVHVIEGDVADTIGQARGVYDAILLDVDNGPKAFTAPTNRRIYDRHGLSSVHRSLKPGGRLAIWSLNDDPGFTARLLAAGFDADTERVLARRGGKARHVLWIADRKI